MFGCKIIPILQASFWLLLPQTPKIRSPYLDLLDFFSKELTYDFSYVLDDQIPGKKSHLILNTASLQRKNK